jgi:tetratricopeptide (TPR) repeat protein
MKSPIDPDAESRDRLMEWALRMGFTRSGLAKAMGHSHGYFQNVEKVQLGRLVDALSHLGIPPQAFFDSVFRGQRVDPVLALRLESESPRPVRHLFLDELAAAVAELGTYEIDAAVAAPSHRTTIEQLEELRFRDHERARLDLEQLLELLLKPIPDAANGRFPALLLGEAAAALTAWAAIARMNSQRDVAGQALAIAFSLARWSKDAWAEGLCYQRGVYLMREFGRSDLALDWVDEARDRFERSGHSKERLQLLVDRATVLLDLEQREEAHATFEAALQRLPTASFRHLAGAYTGLANLAGDSGDSKSAIAFFKKALSCFREPDYTCAFLYRGLGRAQLASLDHNKGLASLRRSIALLQKHGSDLEVALVAIETAGLLVQHQPKELPSLAADLKAWLPGSRRNRVIRDHLNHLVALIELGRLTSMSLEEVEAQLRRDIP